MELWVLLLVFFVLLILGSPLAYTLCISAISYILLSPTMDFNIIPKQLSSGVDSFPLLAVPFFLFAGTLMNNIGVTDKLFLFARKIVGHFPGSLGHVNVLASMLFAGMSGSAIADAGGLGAIEVRAMKNAGYKDNFSAAITAASSCIGPIIPPSIIIVVYAVLAEQSIGQIFAASIIPGILMGLSLMIYIYIVAKIKPKDFPTDDKSSLREVYESFKSSILPLLAPVILLLGIFSGVFTATEAGAVVIVYVVIIGGIYKSINIKSVLDALNETMKGTVVTLFFIASASVFMWIVTMEQLPETILNGMLTMTTSKTIILFLIIMSLFVMGMFFSVEAALILVTPILLTIAQTINVDPVHLGVFVIVTLMLGIITPPVGVSLFIVSEVSGVKYAELSRAIIPFIIPLFIVVLIITYFPSISMFLPDLLYK